MLNILLYVKHTYLFVKFTYLSINDTFHFVKYPSLFVMVS